jgi:tetratricopeptide (TPR) repeat protein
MPSWRALARVHERLGRLDAAFGAWGRVEACLGMPHPDVAAAAAIDLAAARTEARRERARLKSAADLASATRHVQELIGQDAVDAAVAAAAVEALVVGRANAMAEGAADGADTAVVVSPFLLTLAGTLARKVGDLERARSLLDTAVADDSKDLEAWRNLATVCLAQGDIAAAIKASQAAYRLDPVDAGLVCNLGVCHLAAADAGLGNVDEAREYIELAARLAPKDPIVQRAMATLISRAQPG